MKIKPISTKQFSRRLLSLAFLIAFLAIGFVSGFWMPRDDDFFALRKNFQIFSSVYEELVGGYVDPLSPERIMRSGIDAMLEDLDPYTTFIDEADNADIDIITRGRYGGVGLNIGIRGGQITVVSPVEGASGYKQGVRAGDIITYIAGQSTKNLSLKDIRNLMRGEPGTAVEIIVSREGIAEPLHFLLTREEVTLKNVTYSGFLEDDLSSGIGYIKLDRFAREADAEVRKALQELQASGSLQGVVLDLRDNPGGLLDAAVKITQLFVPQGSVIVSTRGRLPQTERTYRSQTLPMIPDLPLAVLVNEYSASASEIVAGAIQDLDRGIVIGVPTFGKGLVQVIRPLPYNTSLKMTTSRYYTPSGRSIQAIDYGQHDGTSIVIADSLRHTYQTALGRTVRDGGGIEPDVRVTGSEQSELEQALDRRAAFFFFANFFAAAHPTLPDDYVVTDETLKQFRGWLDEQEFSYRLDAERSLEKLAEDLGQAGYDQTTAGVQALMESIGREKAADFERHKERLKERLRTEIMARYHGESVQIKETMLRDVQLLQAASVLRDSEKYAVVLGSGK